MDYNTGRGYQINVHTKFSRSVLRLPNNLRKEIIYIDKYTNNFNPIGFDVKLVGDDEFNNDNANYSDDSNGGDSDDDNDGSNDVEPDVHEKWRKFYRPLSVATFNVYIYRYIFMCVCIYILL